jgi:DNA-binding transcriptional LysR family regulator
LGAGSVVQFFERGVQKIDTQRVRLLLDRVRWDDLHALRYIADRRSFRSAAETMGISLNTVRARLARLEQSLGITLFARKKEGLEITAAGRSVLDIAESMFTVSEQLPRASGNRILARDGQLSICASEGIASFWLSPKLMALRDQLDGLLVSLDSFSDQSKLVPSEHDISIGFAQPADLDTVSFKIATVHMIPYASLDYLEQHGEPSSLDEISGHKCVQQLAPGLKYDILDHFLGSEATGAAVQYRVNSSFALLWAVTSGVGIAGLPTYVSTLSDQIRPVNLPIRLKFDLWASYHSSSRESQPVKTAIKWLKSCFDPVRYPWFMNHFVHPSEVGFFEFDQGTARMFDHLIDGCR